MHGAAPAFASLGYGLLKFFGCFRVANGLVKLTVMVGLEGGDNQHGNRAVSGE